MSKRALILGSTGMLGRRVVSSLVGVGWQVTTIRSVDRISAVVLRDYDCIINCAGIIPPRNASAQVMIEANATLPHMLADAAGRGGIPLLHISTDCVFSGVPDWRQPARRYRTTETPYPRDIYGRSKLLGEVQAEHVTNVRTSFIGPEHGLWAWLVSQQGQTVDGWINAFWTGSTVDAVAAAIAAMAEHPPGGTVHLATSEKLSKLTVLLMLKEHLGLEVSIKAVQEPRIDRALEATIVLPSLADALAALKVPEAVTA